MALWALSGSERGWAEDQLVAHLGRFGPLWLSWPDGHGVLYSCLESGRSSSGAPHPTPNAVCGGWGEGVLDDYEREEGHLEGTSGQGERGCSQWVFTPCAWALAFLWKRILWPQ